MGVGLAHTMWLEGLSGGKIGRSREAQRQVHTGGLGRAMHGGWIVPGAGHQPRLESPGWAGELEVCK